MKIRITHGSQYVTQEDQDRALAAAQKAFGTQWPEDEAYASYQRQTRWTPGHSCCAAGGAWHHAERAADIALTQGWEDIDGASCELYV